MVFVPAGGRYGVESLRDRFWAPSYSLSIWMIWTIQFLVKCWSFANDTKLYATVDNQAQGQSLQRDIDILGDWVLQWQIKFNTDKCKVIHYGRKSSFQCNLYGQSVVDVDSVQKRTWVWCSAVTSKSVFSVVKRTTEPVSLLVSFTESWSTRISQYSFLCINQWYDHT